MRGKTALSRPEQGGCREAQKTYWNLWCAREGKQSEWHRSPVQSVRALQYKHEESRTSHNRQSWHNVACLFTCCIPHHPPVDLLLGLVGQHKLAVLVHDVDVLAVGGLGDGAQVVGAVGQHRAQLDALLAAPLQLVLQRLKLL